MMAYSLVAFVGVTLLLEARPIISFYFTNSLGLKLIPLLVPQVIPLSIPIALPLGIVCGVSGTCVSARRIRGVLLLAIAATLLAFAAMLIFPVANQAFRVAVAKKLGRSGVTVYSLPRGISELSISELASRGKEYDAGGFPQHARKFSLAYHIRFALPAATFVLSLLSLGICGILRGRARRVVALVLALCLYWTTLALAESNTTLPPVAAVWAPNIMCTAISLALLKVLPGRMPTALRGGHGSSY